MPSWRGSPCDKPLTKMQEKFVTLVAVEQMSQANAYREAYPTSKKWTQACVEVQAFKTLKIPNVQKYYNSLIQSLRDESIRTATWSREKAIEAATFVYESGRKEIERIERAFEEEIDALMLELEQAVEANMDASTIREIREKITKARKAKRMAMTPTQAMQGAMETLNKLQGYNKEVIDINADVVFSGEDKLED